MEPSTFPCMESFLEGEHRAAADCLLVDSKLAATGVLDLRSRLASTGSRAAVVVLSVDGEPAAPGAAARSGSAFVRISDPAELLLKAIRDAVGALAPSP